MITISSLKFWILLSLCNPNLHCSCVKLDQPFKISLVRTFMFIDIYAILCNVNCFFSIAGKILEGSKPEYATCRSLLRSGLASSLRVNIRAVSWKPSGIVEHSSILYLLFQILLLRLTSKCLYISVFLSIICFQIYYSILLVKEYLKRSLISEHL